MEEEETVEMVEDRIVISDAVKEIAEKPSPFKGTVCKGCGAVLGLKLALQLVENPVLVVSDDHVSSIRNFINVPSIKSSNPVAAASAISRSLDCTVVCYTDHKTTAANLSSIFANRKENMIYISYNTSLNDRFSESLPQYSASASVSHLDDYIAKLKKVLCAKVFPFL